MIKSTDLVDLEKNMILNENLVNYLIGYMNEKFYQEYYQSQNKITIKKFCFLPTSFYREFTNNNIYTENVNFTSVQNFFKIHCKFPNTL